MKKFKFNKTHKISLIIITSVLIINVIYTYKGYQASKTRPENQLSMKNAVMNINNNLSSDYIFGDLYHLVKNSLNIYTDNRFIAFDNSLTPFYNNSYYMKNTLYYGSPEFSEEEKIINIDNLDYMVIKEITNYIKELYESGEKVIATFNYDAITDKDIIIVKEITYLSINDRIFIENKKGNLISKEINNINSALGHYSYDGEEDSYFNMLVCNTYDYLETKLNDVVNKDKFDDNGYYEITYSDEKNNEHLNPIEYTIENDEHIKLNRKACFQKLGSMYGVYADKKNDKDLYQSSEYDKGYIAWIEYYTDSDLYTFTTYLSNNYINYLISLLLVIGSYFLIKIIVNEKTKIETIDKSIIKQPKVKRKVTNKEDVNLENKLTNLISSGKNLFIFKNIELNYHNNPLVVLGNKVELTKVINNLFHFTINHSIPKNTLDIKIENKKIYFINNDYCILDNDLQELNDVFEIIEAHDFQYSFNLSQNSYEIIIDFNIRK